MSLWFVTRLRLGFSSGENNALAVLLGLGIKSFLLFIFVVFTLKNFIVSPAIFSILVFFFYVIWIKFFPLSFDDSLLGKPPKDKLYKFSGFWILLVLSIFSLLSAWFFPITSADGIWHHVKGMVYSFPLIDFESNQIISQFKQYPPLIGFIYGWLISANLERLPILFPVLYVCLLFIFFHKNCEHIKDIKVAGLGTLVLGTTPYLWWHSFLPFLDWTAGVFYAVGILYWFSLIKNILDPTVGTKTKQNKSLALLSGLFFGFASWTRPEFFLYSTLPLFLLVCAFDRHEEFSSEREPVILRFGLAAFILPSLWFFILLTFDSPLHSIFKQLIMGCAASWIGLGLVSFRLVRFSPRVSVLIGIFSVFI